MEGALAVWSLLVRRKEMKTFEMVIGYWQDGKTKCKKRGL